MTNSIIGALESVAAADAAIADLEAQERACVGKVAKALSEHNEALTAWKEKSAAAFESGKNIEPAPEEPPAREVGERLRRDLRARIARARSERLRAIVAASEQVDEEAERIVSEGREAATPLIASLESIVAKIASAQAAVRQVRDARHALDSSKSVHPTSASRVDLASLLASVRHGTDLLAEHRADARRLGMQEGAVWTQAEPPPEPPLLPPPPEPTTKGLVPSPRGGFQRAEPRLR